MIARTFVRDGARVALADLDSGAVSRAATELSRGGGQTLAVTMDVTREEQVDDGISQVVQTLGRIDVLVCKAGIQIISPLEALALADWRRVLAVHLDGAFLPTRAALPHMYAARRGSIIYMGSGHSKEASVLKAPYVTAKHWLIGLAKVVAKEGALFSASFEPAALTGQSLVVSHGWSMH